MRCFQTHKYQDRIHNKYGATYLQKISMKFYRCNAVYLVALKQPSGISLFFNHRTADVQLTLDITVMLVLVPVELSTSIYVSHAATYVVNAYAFQICVYLRK